MRNQKIIRSILKNFYSEYSECFIQKIPAISMIDYLAGVEAIKNGGWGRIGASEYNKFISPSLYGPEIIKEWENRIIFHTSDSSDDEEGFNSFLIQVNPEFHVALSIYLSVEDEEDTDPRLCVKAYCFYKNMKDCIDFMRGSEQFEIDIDKNSGMGFKIE